MLAVKKRDGILQKFSLEKLKNSILKASCPEEVSEDEAINLAKIIENNLSQEKEITTEKVFKETNKVLIDSHMAALASAFASFSKNRALSREKNSELMKIYDGLTNTPANKNNTKRENANIDGDTAMGTMLKYGSEGAKRFYELYILKPEIAKAHMEGDIHIHDLDFLPLTTTCCQIDLNKLFTNGFSTGHGFLREPNDIMSYSALACIAIQSNQNDQHGGQSIPNFDYDMAKGVAKTYKNIYTANLVKGLELLSDIQDPSNFVKNSLEKAQKETGLFAMLETDLKYDQKETEFLSEKILLEIVSKVKEFAHKEALKDTQRRTYQAMEAFIHNLNTMHSRAGAQVPFSSINYGTDTSPEGRLVIKNVLLATEKGLGNGETAIFPIHIFKVKEGVNYNPGDPNYDLFKLACRVSAKRLFPNFSFLDSPFNLSFYKKGKPETEAAYMGCRTRVIANVFDPSREIVTGRGNLSFTSINLPRLALLSKGNIDLFFEKLKNMLDLVIEQLLDRFQLQAKRTVKNAPFLMGQGVWLDSEKLKPTDEIREVIKHGTLTAGFIGLAECLVALMGKHHGESEESQNLGLKIVKFMRDSMDCAAKKYKLNFSLIATPAEGLSGRFVKLDKEKFGVIPKITDRDYYTNSFHVPVYYKISAFNKIKIEAPYHSLTNGGHISYVELDGDPSKNLEAFERIIRCMKELGIGYGSINHPVDRDPVCNYTGIIDDVCPKCKRKETEGTPKFERIRRITGYLVGTLDRFNDAKKAEERDRVKHSV